MVTMGAENIVLIGYLLRTCHEIRRENMFVPLTQSSQVDFPMFHKMMLNVMNLVRKTA